MKELNFKIGNIELRPYRGWSDPELDGDITGHYEFVCWVNDGPRDRYCYVVSFAYPTDDGDYYIKNVGRRPRGLKTTDREDYDAVVDMFFSFIKKIKRTKQ